MRAAQSGVEVELGRLWSIEVDQIVVPAILESVVEGYLLVVVLAGHGVGFPG